VKDKVKVQQQP